MKDVNLRQKIDTSRPLNFVVHGFLSSFRGGMVANYQGPISDCNYLFFDINIRKHLHLCLFISVITAWPYQMSADWSKFANANTCAVDWSRLALVEYGIAANNVRRVANQMILFMNDIIPLGIPIEIVSVAGHSLGAHVAGFFGAGFHGQVNAIFGSEHHKVLEIQILNHISLFLLSSQALMQPDQRSQLHL